MPHSLSILIASAGRPSLTRTLATLAPQVRPGDEILVDVNDDSPWGHKARNRMMLKARGDWLMFIDDDDWYEPDALAKVRLRVELLPQMVHMFSMHYGVGVLWQEKEVVRGNVSTQMFVVPNLWRSRACARQVRGNMHEPLPRWSNRYEGDLDFITGCVELLGEPVWYEEVIATYGRLHS